MRVVLYTDDGVLVTDWWWPGDRAITIRRGVKRWAADCDDNPGDSGVVVITCAKDQP